jgi:activator of 2-hydroxyglutaryl-CoA dehydratase
MRRAVPEPAPFWRNRRGESLNVLTEDIAEGALRGENPPNFTDQCSAFISSDIKIAGQVGISKDDILAGSFILSV